MGMMGLASQGAAWLQCCLSPARGCWQKNLPLPTAGTMGRHLSSCGQWKRQSKVSLWQVEGITAWAQMPQQN